MTNEEAIKEAEKIAKIVAERLMAFPDSTSSDRYMVSMALLRELMLGIILGMQEYETRVSYIQYLNELTVKLMENATESLVNQGVN